LLLAFALTGKKDKKIEFLADFGWRLIAQNSQNPDWLKICAQIRTDFRSKYG